MRYRFYTADVFTDRAFGGNPLAMLPDALDLTDDQMLAVTREFNYSETVFVLPPDDPENTRKLRIFTPGGEIPFAGHPTIGSAHILTAIGEITLDGDRTSIAFEEGVGRVPVSVQSESGTPVFAELTAAQLPEFDENLPSMTDLAKALSLHPDEILNDSLAPEIVSCGVPYLIVPVRDRDALGRAQIDRAQWNPTFADCSTSEVYLICQDPERADADLRARMFAPNVGIDEDPATGSAAAALAGYLGAANEAQNGTLQWTVKQGVEMERPSILYVETDKRDGTIVEVRVGGSTVVISEGTIEIPPVLAVSPRPLYILVEPVSSTAPVSSTDAMPTISGC